MSDGRTQWTRDNARAAWSRSGITYADLTPARVERLRHLINAEMRSGEYLRGTFRANHKPKKLRAGLTATVSQAWGADPSEASGGCLS